MKTPIVSMSLAGPPNAILEGAIRRASAAGVTIVAAPARIAHFTINPVAAWEIVPGLSVAAGPTANYSEAVLKRGIGFIRGDEFKFEGDGWDVGFNAGIRWQPHPKHAVGLSYRSESSLNYDGDSSTSPSPPYPASQTASAEFDFPQHIVVGYSFRPTERWNLEVNVDWTDWDPLKPWCSSNPPATRICPSTGNPVSSTNWGPPISSEPGGG